MKLYFVFKSKYLSYLFIITFISLFILIDESYAEVNLLPSFLISNSFMASIPNNVIRYASPSGRGVTCSKTSPCDIYNAVNEASPGDEIHLKAGTYMIVNEILVDTKNTSAHRRITIKPEGSKFTATINGINLRRSHNCLNIVTSNVTVEGLEFTNCLQGNGIKVDGDFRGGTYDHSRDSNNYDGKGYRNYHADGADGVIIRNNYIHNVSLDGIKANHLNNILIEGNEIYKTSMVTSLDRQQGIDLVGVYNSVIRGNVIHDDISNPQMSKAIFFKGGSENITVENNYIYNIRSESPVGIEVGGDTEPYNHRYTASKFPNPFAKGLSINKFILTQDYSYFSTPANYIPYEHFLAEARNCVIRGNIIRDTGYAISLRNAYFTKIYNNTFYDAINPTYAGPSGNGVVLWDDQDSSHRTAYTFFYNNIVYNTRKMISGAMYWDRGNERGNSPCGFGFAADYNVIYNGGAKFSMKRSWHVTDGSVGTHNLYTHPLIGTDFRLQPGSPAIGKGIDLRSIGILNSTESWIDMDGKVRSTQTDIGALMF